MYVCTRYYNNMNYISVVVVLLRYAPNTTHCFMRCSVYPKSFYGKIGNDDTGKKKKLKITRRCNNNVSRPRD